MQLEQRDKELAAIGASIGCNCRPCIEHHIAAGRAAGLAEAELVAAVATARVVRDEAIELLAAVIDELLGGSGARPEPATIENSRVDELVSIELAPVAATPPCRLARAPTQPCGDQGGGQDGGLRPAARERDDSREREARARSAVGRRRYGGERLEREVET